MSIERRELVLAGTVVLVGAALRLAALGAESLTNDEMYSLHFVQTYSPVEFLARYPTIDPHPPLYYLLLDGWTTAFGTSEVAARFPSVLFGLGTIVATYLLGRRAFDGRVGLVAATFVSLSTLHVYHAQEVRMYTALSFFTALSTYHFVGAVEVGSRRRLAWYALSTIGLLFTHVFGAFVVLSHVLFLAVDERQAIARLELARLRPWATTYLGVGLVYLPLVALVARQVLLVRERGTFISWIDPPSVAAVPRAFLTYVGYQPETPVLLARAAPFLVLLAVPVAVLALQLFGIQSLGIGPFEARSLVPGRSGADRDRGDAARATPAASDDGASNSDDGTSTPDDGAATSDDGASNSDDGASVLDVAPNRWILLCCLWIGSVHAVPWLLSYVVTPVYVPRYTMSASVGAFVLAGVGFWTVVDAVDGLDWPSIGARHVSVVLAAVLVVTLLVPAGSYYSEHQRDQWRDAVADVDGAATADDAVVLVSDGPELADLSIVYRHYAGRERGTIVPVGSKDETYYDQVASMPADHDRIWLLVGRSHSVTDAEQQRFVDALSEHCDPLEERRYTGVDVRSFDC